MTDLTDKQKAVLDFIRQWTVDHGYPPSFREIGEKFGLRSTNSVGDFLNALVRKGRLVREAGRSRSMRVIDPPATSEGSEQFLCGGTFTLTVVGTPEPDHGIEAGDVLLFSESCLEDQSAGIVAVRMGREVLAFIVSGERLELRPLVPDGRPPLSEGAFKVLGPLLGLFRSIPASPSAVCRQATPE